MIFYIIAVLFLLYLCLVYFVLPSLFDKNTQEVENVPQDEEDERPLIGGAQRPAPKTIGYCDLLCNIRYFFASFTGVILIVCVSYCNAIM